MTTHLDEKLTGVREKPLALVIAAGWRDASESCAPKMSLVVDMSQDVNHRSYAQSVVEAQATTHGLAAGGPLK